MRLCVMSMAGSRPDSIDIGRKDLSEFRHLNGFNAGSEGEAQAEVGKTISIVFKSRPSFLSFSFLFFSLFFFSSSLCDILWRKKMPSLLNWSPGCKLCV